MNAAARRFAYDEWRRRQAGKYGAIAAALIRAHEVDRNPATAEQAREWAMISASYALHAAPPLFN